MSPRPYRALDKFEIAQTAQAAAMARDDATFEACIDELRERRRSEDLIEELLELRETAPSRSGRPSVSQALSVADVSETVVLTDAECWSRGLSLMRRAKRSIWLSTYTLVDSTDELRITLAERVRAGVRINMIVSKSSRANGGPSPQATIADLKRSGVRVVECTNHSKCIVVDGEFVILGSANLRPLHFGDVSIQLRSLSVANLVVEFLEGISAP